MSAPPISWAEAYRVDPESRALREAQRIVAARRALADRVLADTGDLRQAITVAYETDRGWWPYVRMAP